MKNGKILTILSVIVAVFLLAAGCGTTPAPAPTPTPTPTPAPTPTPTPTPKPAPAPAPTPAGPTGEVVLLVGAMGSQVFDPGSMSGSYQVYMDALYAGGVLLTQDNKLIPGFFTSWVMGTDGKSWTFKIRQGAKFNNGEEITAEDIKFDMERYALGSGISSDTISFARNLDKIEAPDRYTLVYYAKNPDPNFPRFLAAGAGSRGYFYPKNYFEKVGEAGFKARPVGAGPFKFVKSVVGDYVQLEAFADYYVEERVPTFKNLTFRLVPELSSRLAGLKTGFGDIVEASPGVKPDIEAAGLKTISITEVGYAWGWFFGAAVPGTPFYKKEVRQALNLAIDRDAIVKNILFGEGGPMVQGHMTPSAFGVTSAFKANQYDPEKAKQLLKDAGYATGLDFTIYTYEGEVPNTPRIAELIASYFDKVGVKAKIQIQDMGTLNMALTAGKLNGQMLIRPNNATVDYGGRFNSYLRSTGNNIYFPIPALDSLIDKAVQEIDVAKREAAYQSVYKYTADEYVGLGIVYSNGVAGIGPKIMDYKPRAIAGNLSELWSVRLTGAK